MSYTLPETLPRKSLPTWLVTVLVAAIAVGALFGVYRLLGTRNNSGAATATAGQAAATDSSNPYGKFVEVTGVRIVEDNKQHVLAHLLVVNHSTADLPDLELEVAIGTTTAKPGDEPLATVTVKTGAIPANESKDIAAPLKTKARAYELPDWQFLKTSVAIKEAH